MLVKLSRGRFYFDRRRVAAARRPCRRCCWSSWRSASARRCRARRAAGASTPRWRTSSCCSAFSTSRGGATGPAAAIIILQLACHPGVLAAVSPGLHVHLRAPHPPDLMGGIFLYGGTTGIMSCLIFDHFKYFLENNIFQHYNVWFISSIFIFLMSWCTYICILVTVTCVQVSCTLPVVPAHAGTEASASQHCRS